MLGTTDDQHLPGADRQVLAAQVTGQQRPLMGTAGMRLIAQQRVQITAQRQLAQGLAQQVGLAGQRRVVEVEVEQVAGGRLLIDAVSGRHGRLADEGAASGFAADQAHGVQLGVDPRGGDQRDAVVCGQLAVGGQARAGCQHATANVVGQAIDDLFVACQRHGGCIHDNNLIVMIRAPKLAGNPPVLTESPCTSPFSPSTRSTNSTR